MKYVFYEKDFLIYRKRQVTSNGLGSEINSAKSVLEFWTWMLLNL
ncbi:hypothetical protein THF1C08_320095 [Vibrio jasicida]|uniref:Uncharacterized protein n=1 Tax=Vibrio jasicida TaxID=766224 RepID=A0AAU9QQ46_9VIBR|nr:hypothetical protein THF1C08_320095 [Vibrio jasicida]CAH1597546.1 hypothetical protein THF1A12_320095 [Vibrio jasicida]